MKAVKCMQPHPLGTGDIRKVIFFCTKINFQARASCMQNLIMHWCVGVEADGTNLKFNKTGNSIKWKIQQVAASATLESRLVTRHLWSCCSHKSGNHQSTV